MNNGAKVNSQDIEGVTSLMIAAGQGSVEMAKLLLENSANVRAKERYGRTAMDIAVAGKHSEVVKILQEHSRLAKKT